VPPGTPVQRRGSDGRPPGGIRAAEGALVRGEKATSIPLATPVALTALLAAPPSSVATRQLERAAEKVGGMTQVIAGPGGLEIHGEVFDQNRSRSSTPSLRSTERRTTRH
jgi:hypothetical protein